MPCFSVLNACKNYLIFPSSSSSSFTLLLPLLFCFFSIASRTYWCIQFIIYDVWRDVVFFYYYRCCCILLILHQLHFRNINYMHCFVFSVASDFFPYFFFCFFHLWRVVIVASSHLLVGFSSLVSYWIVCAIFRASFFLHPPPVGGYLFQCETKPEDEREAHTQ